MSERQIYSNAELETRKARLISKTKKVSDIVREDWWWLFYDYTRNLVLLVAQDMADKEQQILVKIETLIEKLNEVNQNILTSENELSRKINEIQLDVVNYFLEVTIKDDLESVAYLLLKLCWGSLPWEDSLEKNLPILKPYRPVCSNILQILRL